MGVLHADLFVMWFESGTSRNANQLVRWLMQTVSFHTNTTSWAWIARTLVYPEWRGSTKLLLFVLYIRKLQYCFYKNMSFNSFTASQIWTITAWKVHTNELYTKVAERSLPSIPTLFRRLGIPLIPLPWTPWHDESWTITTPGVAQLIHSALPIPLIEMLSLTVYYLRGSYQKRTCESLTTLQIMLHTIFLRT